MTVKSKKARTGNGPRQHGESIHSKRRIAAVYLQQQALELRKQGLSYRLIGEQLKCSTQNAQLSVEAALKRVLQEPADAVRKLEAERLDAMFAGTYLRAAGGDHASIYACLQIMARRARLMGLDAPNISGLFGGVASVNPDGSPMSPEQVASHIRQLAGSLLPSSAGDDDHQ